MLDLNILFLEKFDGFSPWGKLDHSGTSWNSLSTKYSSSTLLHSNFTSLSSSHTSKSWYKFDLSFSRWYDNKSTWNNLYLIHPLLHYSTHFQSLKSDNVTPRTQQNNIDIFFEKTWHFFWRWRFYFIFISFFLSFFSFDCSLELFVIFVFLCLKKVKFELQIIFIEK